MDPDEALARLREARQRCDSAAAGLRAAGWGDDVAAVLDSTAEAIEAIDGWMSEGGFRPKDWVR